MNQTNWITFFSLGRQCIIKVIVPTVDFWMLNVTLDLPRWEQQADEQLEQFISRTTELSQFWWTIRESNPFL